jgi:hypothetical protein
VRTTILDGELLVLAALGGPRPCRRLDADERMRAPREPTPKVLEGAILNQRQAGQRKRAGLCPPLSRRSAFFISTHHSAPDLVLLSKVDHDLTTTSTYEPDSGCAPGHGASSRPSAARASVVPVGPARGTWDLAAWLTSALAAASRPRTHRWRRTRLHASARVEPMPLASGTMSLPIVA